MSISAFVKSVVCTTGFCDIMLDAILLYLYDWLMLIEHGNILTESSQLDKYKYYTTLEIRNNESLYSIS